MVQLHMHFGMHQFVPEFISVAVCLRYPEIVTLDLDNEFSQNHDLQ